MDRACKNCRFCIYAHSMRGKEEPYCGRFSKWIGDTLLCSEWEMASVPKPQTNADRIRAMSDEELAEWVWGAETAGRAYGPRGKKAWIDWLKEEAET